MKANEFVRKHGLNSFKAAMVCPQFARHKYAIIYSDEIDFSNELIEKHADYMFKVSEIKRLVESHELVEKYKKGRGIRFRIRWGQFRYDDTKEYNDRLKQAIADVESCLEADKKLEGL